MLRLQLKKRQLLSEVETVLIIKPRVDVGTYSVEATDPSCNEFVPRRALYCSIARAIAYMSCWIRSSSTSTSSIREQVEIEGKV